MFRFSLITVIVAAVALTSPLSGAAAERKAAPLTVAATPKSAPAGYAFTVKAKGRKKLPKRCDVVVRVGGSRAKPAERVVLRRGAKVQVRIGGKPGRRTIEVRCGNRRAFSAVTIAKPKRDSADHGELDPSVIPENAETAGPDSGGPAPDLRLPFPCGEDWQSSTYGGHGNALDWNQPGDRDAGRPIVASAAGSVFVAPAGQYNGGYGNYVIVNHGGGWSTLYAHFRGYAVSNGQNVQRGQVLGYVGTTGNSTGNHLHYEQRLNRVAQPVRHSGGGVAAGRTYRSDNCDTSGGAGDPGGPAGQSPSTTASFPMRLGVLQTDGKASVKEGGVSTNYTVVAESVKQLEMSGNRVGVVQRDGKAWVKEGGIDATYTLVAENVKQLELSGNRLGVVQNDGKASVKEGPLNATYTLVAENVAQLDMAGTLLGVLQNDGKTWVKQGPLNATYTLVAEAVAQLALLKE